VIKVLLEEAPAIEVQKKGETFKIPEIPAYDVARVHQFLVGMVPDEIEQVFKILFGKEAERARPFSIGIGRDSSGNIITLGKVFRMLSGPPYHIQPSELKMLTFEEITNYLEGMTDDRPKDNDHGAG
jgi:hypothetical protein